LNVIGLTQGGHWLLNYMPRTHDFLQYWNRNFVTKTAVIVKYLINILRKRAKDGNSNVIISQPLKLNFLRNKVKSENPILEISIFKRKMSEMWEDIC
jgi:hypothetical protein